MDWTRDKIYYLTQSLGGTENNIFPSGLLLLLYLGKALQPWPTRKRDYSSFQEFNRDHEGKSVKRNGGAFSGCTGYAWYSPDLRMFSMKAWGELVSVFAWVHLQGFVRSGTCEGKGGSGVSSDVVGEVNIHVFFPHSLNVSLPSYQITFVMFGAWQKGIQKLGQRRIRQ